jgi:hypothetical protein
MNKISNTNPEILKRLTPNISEETRGGKYYQMLANASYDKGKKK